MRNVTASPLGPDAPDSLNDRFRVEGRFAIRSLLRTLMTRRSLVTLYPEGRADAPVVARIVQVATDRITLDASGQPRHSEALRDARFAIGVAFLEKIKMQFRVESISRVDEPVRSTRDSTTASVVTILHAPMPTDVYRLERRETFRVRPPDEDAAHCVQRIGIGKELRHPIIDVSAGGLSIRLAADAKVPAPGRIWHQCRIEAAGSLVTDCALVVRSVHDDPRLEGDRRVGFAFHAMPTEALRRVQVYVLDIEKRERRRG